MRHGPEITIDRNSLPRNWTSQHHHVEHKQKIGLCNWLWGIFPAGLIDLELFLPLASYLNNRSKKVHSYPLVAISQTLFIFSHYCIQHHESAATAKTATHDCIGKTCYISTSASFKDLQPWHYGTAIESRKSAKEAGRQWRQYLKQVVSWQGHHHG